MKLHLRDLFWLLLVCGLAVGWWVAATERDDLRVKLLIREMSMGRGTQRVFLAD